MPAIWDGEHLELYRPHTLLCDDDDEMTEDERREQDEAIEIYNNPDADSDD